MPGQKNMLEIWRDGCGFPSPSPYILSIPIIHQLQLWCD